MKKQILNSQQLESMSTPDLISLADDYGIDIPDDLNRCFVISELIDYFEEIKSENSKNDLEELKEEDNVDLNNENTESLPKSYNDTTIDVLLRNPSWAFVYWDISEAEIKRIKEEGSSLFLQIAFFENSETEKPLDVIETSVAANINEEYIMIPLDVKFFSINLISKNELNAENILASTERIEIDQESDLIKSLKPGMKSNYSDAVKLSGMKDLIYSHYINHRQSFSN